MKHTLVIFLLLTFKYGPVNAQNSSYKKEKLLAQMTAAVSANEYTGMHSILVAVGNKIAYEKYFNGYKQDSLHDSRSSFKSITSLLTGIAIDKGYIKSTAQQIYGFFPEYPNFAYDDSRKRAITIQNLLDMQSGFDCEEFEGTKDCEEEMMQSKDWVKFSLDLPMKHQPGTMFAYTSCDPMILSGIISKAAHMPVMDFARKYLFAPLGITDYKWTVDPSGNAMTAGSFYIRPRDMLKIGQLLNNGGTWKGQRVISERWIGESIKTSIAIPGFSFAKSSRSEIFIPQQTFYGNFWYKESIRTVNLREDMLFASGNGGQLIITIKRLDMVVVFTQGNFSSWKAKRAFELLGKYILPAFVYA